MPTTTKSQPFYFALSLLGILHFLIFSEATTLHLIHRDSPLSPFYDPSATHFDRLHNAFQRSFKRINRFKVGVDGLNQGNIQAPMKSGGGEYLVKISIGTPPVEVLGIADTGSDLIWTQCLPCIHCYNQTIPLFNPNQSKSYHTIPCPSALCDNSLGSDAQCNNKTCGYTYSYADGSHTTGNLAFETLTLGISNPISLPNLVFGCAHDTAGIFDASESGIIGLGSGNLSLISQLGTHLSGGKKFSYCLIPAYVNKTFTSKISFGNDALVSGPEVVTTPFTKIPSGFLLTVEAFSVEKERIEFPSEGNNVTKGNIIIDTGTTLTLLPPDVYSGLEKAIAKVIRAKRVSDPNNVFSLCYESSGDDMKLPIITAHFKGGDVKLQPVNTFSLVKKDVLCLAMISNNLGILGNIAQTDFLIGYDLEASTVSFKPTDCTKI